MTEKDFQRLEHKIDAILVSTLITNTEMTSEQAIAEVVKINEQHR